MKKILNSPMFQEFFNRENTKFDLMIAELNSQEAMYLLAHHYKIPLVLFSPTDYTMKHVEAMGAFSIWTHVPRLFKLHDDDKGLWDRFVNRLLKLVYVKSRDYYHITEVDKISKEFFEKSSRFGVESSRYGVDIPSVKILEASAAMYVFNSLQFLEINKAKAEGIVDVAGIHIRRRKDLDPDVKVAHLSLA